jgi:hypothetical protein
MREASLAHAGSPDQREVASLDALAAGEGGGIYLCHS